MFRQRNETGFPNLPILEVSLKTGVRVRDFENSKRKQVMGDKGKYKRAAAGDIAYNMMRMWQGAVGVAPVDGLISPAYVVAEPFPETDTHYFSYLFRTDAYKNEVNKYSHGIVSDRNRLYWDEFKQIPTPFPPTEEQEAIAQFLNFKSSQIAKFIQAKRKLIALLNEQKQAIINQAVTRGLDPNVRLKPSGVDYLGDIPEHWEVKPLKHWAKINDATLPEATDTELPFRYIDIGCVGTGFLSKNPEILTFGRSPSRARRVLKPGDTIISTVRTYLRAVYFFAVGDDFTIASTGFAVLSPRKGVYPKALGYVIQSDPFVDRVTANSIGIAYPAISESKIGSLHVPLPPTLEEQQRSTEYVEIHTLELNEAISRLSKEIDLIREYRTRLISDVVTGKLDVRGIEVEDVDASEVLDDLDEAEEDMLLEEAEEGSNGDE
ncbi:MAG: restriction endonuclease subunit S [Desulfomicrobium sp.]